MLECKHKSILSLNLKKLAYSVDDLKIILILQNEILLFMLFCKRVNKQREGIPKYGNTINNNYFFFGGGRGGVCSNIFCETGLFRNILKHLSTKLVGKELFFNTSFR